MSCSRVAVERVAPLLCGLSPITSQSVFSNRDKLGIELGILGVFSGALWEGVLTPTTGLEPAILGSTN